MRELAAPWLRLVPLGAAHADAMFEVLRDPALYTYDDSDPPQSAQALRERYTRLESRRSTDGTQDWLNWVLLLGVSGRAIGFVQATVERGRGDAWVAFVLARDCWGLGHARRATLVMLDELQLHYGVSRALATAERANQRSLGLLRRLGFAEGSTEEHAALGVAAADLLMSKVLVPAEA
jgi:ribosomal-protein-alanine N-acetyltransferase